MEARLERIDEVIQDHTRIVGQSELDVIKDDRNADLRKQVSTGFTVPNS